MFFVLLNLCREHPLATVHTSQFARLNVILVNCFGVALFALPTSILSTVLNLSMAAKGEEEFQALDDKSAVELDSVNRKEERSAGDRKEDSEADGSAEDA